MHPFFSSLFHDKFRRPGTGAHPISPLAPKRNLFKEYPRFPRIYLSKTHIPKVELSEELQARRSPDSFLSNDAISIEELSAILYSSVAMRKDETRPYPSGGPRYPIEIYVLIRQVKGVDPGVYHYHPLEHALEQLTQGQPSTAGYQFPPHEKLADNAPFALILTACWWRSAGRYGEGAYQLALLEAGHVMQNFILCSQSVHLHVRPIAGFEDDALITLLDLEQDVESPVYMALVGHAKEKESKERGG